MDEFIHLFPIFALKFNGGISPLSKILRTKKHEFKILRT